MKKLFFFLVIGILGNAQEFHKMWGTYYGPAHLAGVNTLNFLPNGDAILPNASVAKDNSLPASYYAQFATTGNPFDLTQTINMYYASFSSAGSLLKAYYYPNDALLLYEDAFVSAAGDRFSFRKGAIGETGTAGTWNTSLFAPSANVLLEKKDMGGNLLWKTYIPGRFSSIDTDPSGNIYITGTTSVQTGITTAGVLQPDFEIVLGANGTPADNVYVAKLSPSGQLLWASYFPSRDILQVKENAGKIYIFSGSDLNQTATAMATTNAFQQTKANFALTKMDGTTGQRIWGTYYGLPIGGTSYDLPISLKIDNSGFWLAGVAYDFDGSYANYYGTPGAHQHTSAGGGDAFISKFNFDGQRIWSTYFGGVGEEFVNSFDGIDVADGNVFLLIGQYGPNITNLATPGADVATPPVWTGNPAVNYYDIAYAKFNSTGNLEWCSYFGGANPLIGFAPQIGLRFSDSQHFYIYGKTTASTGIATPNSYRSTNPNNEEVGFLAKFTNKETELATSEVSQREELALYDNPNNGHFSIRGNILAKESCTATVYDASGKMVLSQKLPKAPVAEVTLPAGSPSGTYMVSVSAGKKVVKTFKMVVGE